MRLRQHKEKVKKYLVSSCYQCGKNYVTQLQSNQKHFESPTVKFTLPLSCFVLLSWNLLLSHSLVLSTSRYTPFFFHQIYVVLLILAFHHC